MDVCKEYQYAWAPPPLRLLPARRVAASPVAAAAPASEARLDSFVHVQVHDEYLSRCGPRTRARTAHSPLTAHEHALRPRHSYSCRPSSALSLSQPHFAVGERSSLRGGAFHAVAPHAAGDVEQHEACGDRPGDEEDLHQETVVGLLHDGWRERWARWRTGRRRAGRRGRQWRRQGRRPFGWRRADEG